MAYDFPNAPTVGQAYSGYTYDGEKWVSTATAPNQSGVIGIQVFTSSGTYTPSASMTTCVIECVGGGGGGGGVLGTATNGMFAGGGGAGGYSRKFATSVIIGPSQPVTIGNGGSGGAGAVNGGPGLDTSVGTLCIAKGAAGGGLSQATSGTGPGGAGGVVGTGDIAASGAPGNGGYYYDSSPTGNVQSSCGLGGSGPFGGGGWGRTSGGGLANGVNGTGNGSGGSGARAGLTAGSATGGAGSPGLVVITEYGMTALSPTAAQLGSVRYDLPQGLTASQRQQARANINVLKKNYIVNGAMMISQENPFAVGTTVSFYPTDQFLITFSNAGAQSVQQVTSTTPGGSPNRIRVICTTADAAVGAGDYLQVLTRLEGLRTADLLFGLPTAKTITVQFGVRAPAGTYCVTVGNSAANRSFVAEYVVAAGEANIDVVKSVVVPGDVTGTWLSDNTRGLVVSWALMAGSTLQQSAGSWGTVANALASANQFNFMGTINNTFELFDVSLTEGNVAPPFQVPDYASELTLCQRYWQRTEVSFRGPTTAVGQTFNVPIYWRVTMRAVPTLTQTTGTRNLITSALANPGSATINSTRFEIVSSGAGDCYDLAEVINANARL